MTNTELLAACKTALNIQQSTTAFDGVITQKLLAVKSYMKGAGISDALMNDDLAVGVIVMGVADIWNVDGGETKFSPVFHTMLTQLAAKSSLLTVASTPADGATGVAVGVKPSLVFNRRIKSYKASIVVYATQEAVAITAEFDITETALTLTPKANLAAATKYAVVIDEAVSRDGPSLSRNIIGFTTA